MSSEAETLVKSLDQSPIQVSKEALLKVLSHYFGFQEFRPLQYEIIDSHLSGKDVLALLPTGGGKSLCYQLPALVRQGLTIVISPLIALMKDQVDALQELGIESEFLNSSLEEAQAKKVWHKLYNGKIKILYLSPERLLMEGMLEKLISLNLSAVAIDEAHCISSWGHDFRPEYRALKIFKQALPQIPILALTATATERVRQDIMQMLDLQDPLFFCASFNRPNLSYRILSKINAVNQITEIINTHQNESGIIYCLSRAQTEKLAEQLQKKKIKALAYHAGLSSNERAKRQDLFVSDQVQVIVATIAFGMGIDKPDVRFVIHHDLPKNLESYYQETGRAGRDGLPSECVLLFSPSDAVKIRSFIDQVEDPDEHQSATFALNQLINFAQSSVCRRVSLLSYFGEIYKDQDGNTTNQCGTCDNCLSPRESIDGKEIALKFLSCVLRIKQKNGFSVGAAHVIDVLCAEKTEKILRWGHHELSTYGIGKEIPKSDWKYYAQELINKGLLSINLEKFRTIEVTPAGMQLLKSQDDFKLTKPMISASLSKEKQKERKSKLGGKIYDESIFEKLRSWRLSLAKSKKIAPYMIMSDATLQEISRIVPQNDQQLSRIHGIGDKKLTQYGAAILDVLRSIGLVR